MDTLEQYTVDLSALMAFYGFISMPLTPHEIETLHDRGIAIEFAYDVASDVAAGFDFWTALSQVA
jgi:hypothetical protein